MHYNPLHQHEQPQQQPQQQPHERPHEQMHCDVAVVGGGIAGLTTAWQLAASGARVILFEARERFGGRVLTLPAAPHPDGAPWLDVGPAWFWPHQRHVQALVEHFGLEVFTQHTQGLATFDQGKSMVPQRFDAAGQLGRSLRLIGGMQSLSSALVEAAIGASTPASLVNNAIVRSVRWSGDTVELLATRVGVISAGADAGVSAGESSVLTAGVNAGATAGARAGVGSGVSVHGADVGASDVPVLCSARAVVIAVPPRVLARDVHFEPALPEALQITLRDTVTWMGHSMKCVVSYAKPFWRDAGLSGYAVSWSGPLQEIHDASMPVATGTSSLNAIMGFAAPRTAPANAAFRSASLSERRSAVVEQLSRLFGSDAQSPLDYTEYDWSAQPLSSGAEDLQPPSEHPSYGAPVFESLTWDGRLAWAGAETSGTEGGYLDGAIASGLRAARLLASASSRH